MFTFATTANVDHSKEFNDSEFDFEEACGVTPTLEDSIEELEDALFWDEISDYIEEHGDVQQADNEDTPNIFEAAAALFA